MEWSTTTATKTMRRVNDMWVDPAAIEAVLYNHERDRVEAYTAGGHRLTLQENVAELDAQRVLNEIATKLFPNEVRTDAQT